MRGARFASTSRPKLSAVSIAGLPAAGRRSRAAAFANRGSAVWLSAGPDERELPGARAGVRPAEVVAGRVAARRAGTPSPRTPGGRRSAPRMAGEDVVRRDDPVGIAAVAVAADREAGRRRRVDGVVDHPRVVEVAPDVQSVAAGDVADHVVGDDDAASGLHVDPVVEERLAADVVDPVADQRRVGARSSAGSPARGRRAGRSCGSRCRRSRRGWARAPDVLPSETPCAPAGASAPSITKPLSRNHCADGSDTIAPIIGRSPG